MAQSDVDTFVDAGICLNISCITVYWNFVSHGRSLLRGARQVSQGTLSMPAVSVGARSNDGNVGLCPSPASSRLWLHVRRRNDPSLGLSSPHLARMSWGGLDHWRRAAAPGPSDDPLLDGLERLRAAPCASRTVGLGIMTRSSQGTALIAARVLSAGVLEAACYRHSDIVASGLPIGELDTIDPREASRYMEEDQ